MPEVRNRIAKLVQGKGSIIGKRLGPESRVVRWMRPLYSAALGWMATADTGLPWSINGVEFRIDIRHRDLMGHEYEQPVAVFMRRLIKSGFVCYDVGANVGAYVLQFCHWSGPAGRVVAFEPNPEARKVLDRHIAMNNVGERVQVVAAAVGAVEDEATLYIAGTEGMNRLGKPNPSLAGRSYALKVPVLTLDGFVRSGHPAPDLILVDVEGFEFSVLMGARETIKARRGAVHLIVEMHPDLWSSAGTGRNQMVALLEELRLHPRSLTGQSDPLGEYGLVSLEYR